MALHPTMVKLFPTSPTSALRGGSGGDTGGNRLSAATTIAPAARGNARRNTVGLVGSRQISASTTSSFQRPQIDPTITVAHYNQMLSYLFARNLALAAANRHFAVSASAIGLNATATPVDAVLGQPLSADTQRTFYRPTAMSDFNNDCGGIGSAYGYGGGYEGDRLRSGGTDRFGTMEAYGNYGRFKRTTLTNSDYGSMRAAGDSGNRRSTRSRMSRTDGAVASDDGGCGDGRNGVRGRQWSAVTRFGGDDERRHSVIVRAAAIIDVESNEQSQPEIVEQVTVISAGRHAGGRIVSMQPIDASGGGMLVSRRGDDGHLDVRVVYVREFILQCAASPYACLPPANLPAMIVELSELMARFPHRFRRPAFAKRSSLEGTQQKHRNLLADVVRQM